MTNRQIKDSYSFQACDSLAKAYGGIAYDSPSLTRFQHEILETISTHVVLDTNTSFLDIGCGKGYFLKYLEESGYKYAQGVEPSELMLSEALVAHISQGSFEKNLLYDHSFDIVFTCHTLHHLPEPWPLYAVKEMCRITKKYLVIVEINNTNLPMYIRSLMLLKQEANAFRYNKKRVKNLLDDAGCHIIYSQDMTSSYLSGNSRIHKAMSKIGNPPYNISIAKVL